MKGYTREYKLALLPSDSEKDGVFGFHVSTCHLEPLVAAAEDILTLYSTDRSTSTLRTYYMQYTLGVTL